MKDYEDEDYAELTRRKTLNSKMEMIKASSQQSNWALLGVLIGTGCLNYVNCNSNLQ